MSRSSYAAIPATESAGLRRTVTQPQYPHRRGAPARVTTQSCRFEKAAPVVVHRAEDRGQSSNSQREKRGSSTMNRLSADPEVERRSRKARFQGSPQARPG